MMMPCFSPSTGGLTCKLLYNLPYNSKHGLPTHCVYVLAFDSDTGAVKVVMVRCFLKKESFREMTCLTIVRVFSSKARASPSAAPQPPPPLRPDTSWPLLAMWPAWPSSARGARG